MSLSTIKILYILFVYALDFVPYCTIVLCTWQNNISFHTYGKSRVLFILHTGIYDEKHCLPISIMVSWKGSSPSWQYVAN